MVKSVVNGNTWAHWYSDGWIEQGTTVTGSSGTFTFPMLFNDNGYVSQYSIYRSSSGSSGWNYHMLYSTKTASQIGYINADSSTNMISCCGWGTKPTQADLYTNLAPLPYVYIIKY